MQTSWHYDSPTSCVGSFQCEASLDAAKYVGCFIQATMSSSHFRYLNNDFLHRYFWLSPCKIAHAWFKVGVSCVRNGRFRCIEPNLNSIGCRSNIMPGLLRGNNNRPTLLFDPRMKQQLSIRGRVIFIITWIRSLYRCGCCKQRSPVPRWNVGAWQC